MALVRVGGPTGTAQAMMLRSIAVVVTIALALPLTSFASHVDVADPDDTRGLLDVRLVDVDGSSNPRYTILTFPRWSTADVYDLGFLLVYLDTFGDERYDYYVLVRSDGRVMEAVLFRDRKVKQDIEIGEINAYRRTKNGVSVRIPLRALRIGRQRVFYIWRVQTLMASANCRRVCFDFVPDAGGVIEPIQTATATVP